MRLTGGHSEVIRKGDKVYKPIVGPENKHEIEVMKRIPFELDTAKLLGIEEGHIVMNYIPGLILSDDLVHALSWEDWRPILRRLLLTLVGLHQANITYGDLSFGNLILSQSKLFLIDFGTSLYLTEEEIEEGGLPEEDKHDDIFAFIQIICTIVGILFGIPQGDSMLLPENIPSEILVKVGLSDLNNDTSVEELLLKLD